MYLRIEFGAQLRLGEPLVEIGCDVCRSLYVSEDEGHVVEEGVSGHFCLLVVLVDVVEETEVGEVLDEADDRWHFDEMKLSVRWT